MIKWLKKNKDIILTTFLVTFLATWLYNVATKLAQGIKLSEVLTFLLGVINYRINIPIFLFLLILIVVFLSYKKYRKLLINKRKFKVLKATYGSEVKSIDITDELNKAVIEDKLKIVLNNNIAGDPHRGVKKKGKVRYEFDKKQDEKEYTEGEVIGLPD